MDTTQTMETKKYLAGVEWLRLLAALGIIWFHAEATRWRLVGYAGLPIFIMVFCLLIVIRYDGIRFRDYLKKRGLRLLLPWLFWSFIFLLAKLGRSYLFKESLWEFSNWSAFLIGGNLHLWYLPFAFLVSIVLYGVGAGILRRKPGYGTLLAIAWVMILSFYLAEYLSHAYGPEPPFAQWLFAFPCLPLGFLIGYLYRAENFKYKKLMYGALMAGVLLMLIHLYRMWGSSLLIPYGLGLWLTMTTLAVPCPYPQAARRWGSLAYGIYLIHPLILFVVHRMTFLQGTILSTVVTFGISAGVVYLLRFTRWRVVL